MPNQTTPDPARTEWQTAAGADAEGLLTYVRPLLTYWWIVAPLALLGGALGLAYSYTLTPLFRGQCRFEIFENEMMRIGEQPGLRDYAYYYANASPLDRHVVLLTSGNLDTRVRARLAKTWPADQTLSRPVGLAVVPVKKAPQAMVDITVDSYDPRYSEAYVTALVEEYRDSQREEMGLIHEETVKNLRIELAKLAADLKTARAEITTFETEHNVQFEEERSESELVHMREVLRKARTIQTQRMIIESQLKLLKNANAATMRDVLDLTMYSTAAAAASEDKSGPEWNDVNDWLKSEGDLIRLNADHAQALTVLKPGHPRLAELQEKIAKAQREQQISAELTLKRLEARRDALRMQCEALEGAAAKIQSGLNLTVADKAKYENLKASAEHLKGLHDKVFARIIDSSSTPTERYFSRIVEGPASSSAPVYPVKSRLVLMGMVLAGGIGAALAFLLFYRYVRLYDLTLLETQLGLPSMGCVPLVTDEAQRDDPRLLNKLSKAAPLCEAYRMIRTAAEEKLGDGKVLLFSSSEQGEGKTFTAAHTAVTCTWTKSKVLLVDGDFRRPSQRKLFGVPDGKGLAECLADNALNWRDVVVRDVAPRLDLLQTGRAEGHGAELIQLESAERLFKEFRAEYDLIILDSAPVNPVVDTLLLARHADGMILVVQPGRTSLTSVQRALRRLGEAPLMGYVANRITASTEKYYYDSKYGHYGHYYHYHADKSG